MMASPLGPERDGEWVQESGIQLVEARGCETEMVMARKMERRMGAP